MPGSVSKILRIIFFFLCLNSLFIQAKAIDTDMQTLQYDHDKIATYQNDSRFDYNSQLTLPEVSIWDLLLRWVGKALQALFGNKFAETYAKPLLIGIFILIILALAFFIYKKRPELFVREKKKSISHSLDDETIHDVDFEDEITRSLKAHDYKLAVRLTYLQTLKYLNDQRYIDWQPYKTPTEYIYEFKMPDGKTNFRKFTNLFLRVRYGNFNAGEDTYREVRELQGAIMKGGNK